MATFDNLNMPVERWKEACKAACIDGNYRSHNGMTETRDDYFVDGVQWADEHPRKGFVDIDKVCEFLKNNARKYFGVDWSQHEWYFERDQLIKDLHKEMEE